MLKNAFLAFFNAPSAAPVRTRLRSAVFQQPASAPRRKHCTIQRPAILGHRPLAPGGHRSGFSPTTHVVQDIDMSTWNGFYQLPIKRQYSTTP
jgi:hypothetical protein